jgi:hypothetical protein
MGIDLHNLALLAHARDRGVSFARSIGIGRQALFVDPPELERHRALRGLPPLREPPAGGPRYFEPLLSQWFGAATVDSVDASAYEQATVLHDMNQPWPAGQPGLGSYDAVLDFGCLEHVFDFPVAWRNCVALCRTGGHLLHALPANNLSGHGFYQFSPELFFNLYQARRGFELLGLWFALKAEPRYWWQVADPAAVRRRVTLRNGHEVYLLVLARKVREPGPLPPPQQSDYAQGEWQKEGGPRVDEGGRGGAARALASLGLLDAARRTRERLRALREVGLGLPAPDYRRIDVGELLRRRASP